MQQNETITKIKDTTSNPAPLGLLGFGMTTVLLNLHNAGYFGFNTMILGMGLAYGGIAQIIAGIQEWKKGNTFGATAFTSYGLFWLSLVALFMLTGYDKPDKTATASYFFMWGLFTLVMFFATLKLNKALQVVFGTCLSFSSCSVSEMRPRPVLPVSPVQSGKLPVMKAYSVEHRRFTPVWPR